MEFLKEIEMETKRIQTIICFYYGLLRRLYRRVTHKLPTLSRVNKFTHNLFNTINDWISILFATVRKNVRRNG